MVQALPAYSMSCYLLPKGVIEDIKTQVRSYWWSGKKDTRDWDMITWDKVCRSKRFDGKGFRDLKLFNIALLGNQVWRLIHDEKSLHLRFSRPSTSLVQIFLKPNLGISTLMSGQAFLRPNMH
ncbi:uncharacterized mitochondrial protein AtMg00310-like [Hibiscus syriacus]|uniref:uncharacterized mitochondrial protein AtMg00310-like n=1 Tax=Hibiscus syriacus TaxID=106335 RepID=UPI00192196ED|nr:uncharacterized mitochondrial protein AtMg00310-like [Hibiscus syriacus]